MCRVHNTPICEMGEGVIQPDLDFIFGTCPDTPDIPDLPDYEVKPELPQLPEADTPLLPDIEVEPETPDIPDIPEIPEQTPDTEVETPDSSTDLQVFSLVNSERAKYGLSPLTYDSTLQEAADIRAVEIKSLFSHTRPNGQSCFTALDEVGYSYRKAGENIAYGQRSAKEVMDAWMNSEGHRANILGDYDYIGIGVYESGGVIYWSQFFAG